jgi:hypothetical protein
VSLDPDFPADVLPMREEEHALVQEDRGEFAALSTDVFPGPSRIENPVAGHRPFFTDDVARICFEICARSWTVRLRTHQPGSESRCRRACPAFSSVTGSRPLGVDTLVDVRRVPAGIIRS